jgi:hypothetical protein
MVVVTWAWPASNCNALTFCVSLPARVRKVCRNACRPASLGKPSCFLVLDDVWWKQDKSGVEEVLAAEPKALTGCRHCPAAVLTMFRRCQRRIVYRAALALRRAGAGDKS